MKIFLLSLVMIYLSLRYILFAKTTKTTKTILLLILSSSIFTEMFISPRTENFIDKTYPNIF